MSFEQFTHSFDVMLATSLFEVRNRTEQLRDSREKIISKLFNYQLIRASGIFVYTSSDALKMQITASLVNIHSSPEVLGYESLEFQNVSRASIAHSQTPIDTIPDVYSETNYSSNQFFWNNYSAFSVDFNGFISAYDKLIAILLSPMSADDYLTSDSKTIQIQQ